MSGPSGLHRFIHRDGRVEFLESPLDLYSVGGVQPYFCQLIHYVSEKMASTPTITTWHTNFVQSRDCPDQALLFLFGDEQGRIPRHIHQLRCILKSGPTSPLEPELTSLSGNYWTKLLALGRTIKNISRDQLRLIPNLPQIIPLPIGVASTFETQGAPYSKPMSERKVDVSFSGSIGPIVRFSSLLIAKSPKSASRLSAVHHIAALKKQRESLRMFLGCTDIAEFDGALEAAEYKSLLKDSKIAICPRGNFSNTFRMYEAAACGCVILCDPQPKSWFVERAPLIIIRDWSRVGRVVKKLLDNPSQLERLSQLTCDWWKNTISPAGAATRLDAILHEYRR